MVISKYRGMFTIKTNLGVEFQISEVKIYLLFANLDNIALNWSLPIVDGLEYKIQPEGLQKNWKRPLLLGWKLIQILIDSEELQKQLSWQYKIQGQIWSTTHQMVARILLDRSGESKLRSLIQDVLTEHGRPIYRDIIATMVKDRDSRFSDRGIYNILSTHKSIFHRYEVGVYGLSSWITNGTGFEPIT
jgi:hypothetical protein